MKSMQRDTTLARRSAILCAAAFIAAVAVEYWPSKTTLNWHSLQEAKEHARLVNKPVLLDVYAEWCPPCKMMERAVFPDDSVKQILTERFVLAKVNIDDPDGREHAQKQLGVKSIPTYIIFGPGGREWKRHRGFIPRADFIRWLKDTTHYFVARWERLPEAQAAAYRQNKRVLVLVLSSGASFLPAEPLFETDLIRQMIGKSYVPALLLQDNPEDRSLLEQLGASTYALGEGYGLFIVLEPDRREVGRFIIQLGHFAESSELMIRLEELQRAPYPQQLPGAAGVAPGLR